MIALSAWILLWKNHTYLGGKLFPSKRETGKIRFPIAFLIVSVFDFLFLIALSQVHHLSFKALMIMEIIILCISILVCNLHSGFSSDQFIVFWHFQSAYRQTRRDLQTWYVPLALPELLWTLSQRGTITLWKCWGRYVFAITESVLFWKTRRGNILLP